MFVPDCANFLFVVALEVVEVAAEMSVVQVQMLLVVDVMMVEKKPSVLVGGGDGVG